jgi:hypothetical protein
MKMHIVYVGILFEYEHFSSQYKLQGIVIFVF